MKEYFERKDLTVKNILSARLNEEDNWELRLDVEDFKAILELDFYSNYDKNSNKPTK